MTAAVAAAFALGLVGSGHCLLMCGPLVAAAQPRAISGAATLHLARVSIYAVLGAVAGAGGASVSSLGWARWVALAAGLALVVHAVRAMRPATRPGVMGRFMGTAVSRLSAWLRRHEFGGPIGVGVVNGLLPCGLVYGALTGAAGMADPMMGAAVMFAFGLGTVPLLASAARPAGAWGRALARRSRLAGPVMLLVMAALVMLRGFGPIAMGHAH